MSAQYGRDNCKMAVAKILQTIGWHSINSTPLEVLTDITVKYLQQLGKTANDYANEFGRTEINLDHLGLAFHETGVSLADLEEYVTYVNFAPGPNPVPKFPVAKDSNLNFLKPGSKEVVTRPVHIHEHLPPMFPLLEGADIKQEVVEEEINPSEQQQFKKPVEVSPEFRRPKREDEGSRPTRELSSVMMTTSGFLSPAREGKLPEARTPAVVVETRDVKAKENPVAQGITVAEPSSRKKVDKKKDKLTKELSKATGDEKPAKKAPTMKDMFKMKQLKQLNAQNLNVTALNNMPTAAQSPNSNVPSVKAKNLTFNKALAAAKAKTEKLNTTITPIPQKSASNMAQVDKLFSEPDKKKANIFKKISNAKDKYDGKNKKDSRSATPNLIVDEPVDIVNKLTHLSSDVTIEPINPAVCSQSPDKNESYFDNGSPPGTPLTPKTPEMIIHSPQPAQKERRKRKDSRKVKRFKKIQDTIESELIDVDMDRPKTPEAQFMAHPRQQMPAMAAPNIPFPFLANFGGPGLIPPQLNPSLFPFPRLPNLPNFGKNPYFPPVVPNAVAPSPVAAVPPEAKSEPKIVEMPLQSSSQTHSSLEASTSSALVEIKDKKSSKEHRKEKKDKLKKKNKKDKGKEKSEKKKIRELKKEIAKEKTSKKEKKEKKKEKEPKVESPIPKILLKVNSPSPRPETPESTRKLNIKPIIVKREDDDKKRDPSPGGLAKISALVTGPPKPKTSHSPTVPSEKLVVDENQPSISTPKTPGRPRLHPLKPKALPKPKKLEQQVFKKTDELGNEVWICPACGHQDDGRPMIGCDGCDAWYHWVCVGIQIPPDENENWYCKPCLCRKNEDLNDKKKKRKKKEKKDH